MFVLQYGWSIEFKTKFTIRYYGLKDSRYCVVRIYIHEFANKKGGLVDKKLIVLVDLVLRETDSEYQTDVSGASRLVIFILLGRWSSRRHSFSHSFSLFKTELTWMTNFLQRLLNLQFSKPFSLLTLYCIGRFSGVHPFTSKIVWL